MELDFGEISPDIFSKAWLPCLLKPEAEGTFGCAPPDYFQIAKYCLHNILTKYVSPLQYSYERLRMIPTIFLMLLVDPFKVPSNRERPENILCYTFENRNPENQVIFEETVNENDNCLSNI